MSLWTNTIISLAFNPAEGVLKRLRFPAITARLISHVTPVRRSTGTDRRSIIPERLRTHQQHMRIKQLKVRGREGGEEEESLFFFFFFLSVNRHGGTGADGDPASAPSASRARSPFTQITAPASHALQRRCSYSTCAESSSLM